MGGSCDQRGTENVLSGLGKFGLRNNNNFGIYDVVDIYDFPCHIPVLDRNKGYELEIRNTIWTKDTKPKLNKQGRGYYLYNHEKKSWRAEVRYCQTIQEFEYEPFI